MANICILGRVGTGKTMIARHIAGRNCVIHDDFRGDVTQNICNARHLNTTNIFVCHYAKDMKPAVRVNMDVLVLTGTPTTKILAEVENYFDVQIDPALIDEQKSHPWSSIWIDLKEGFQYLKAAVAPMLVPQLTSLPDIQVAEPQKSRGVKRQRV